MTCQERSPRRVTKNTKETDKLEEGFEAPADPGQRSLRVLRALRGSTLLDKQLARASPWNLVQFELVRAGHERQVELPSRRREHLLHPVLATDFLPSDA